VASTDEVQTLDLDAAVSHLLDECRMVLPGLQALFGFQMVAVFSDPFLDKLSQTEQRLHIAAIVLVVVAIAFVMAPASLHRQAEPRSASAQFLRVSSSMLLLAMPPLATGICLDVFIVISIILHDHTIAASVAAILFAVFVAFWFGVPFVFRRKFR
jgi:hypothetical protein